MSAPLIPQEIYLLERYSSVAYYGEMRDNFAAMVRAIEVELAFFMTNLPPDYRSRHLSEQADIVWGETVLPNLRWTLDGLNQGYVRMTHGDWDALGQAGNVRSAFAGIRRDFGWHWIPDERFGAIEAGIDGASECSGNIDATWLGEWRPGSLSSRYHERSRGPLMPPDSWPRYKANPAVRVKTGAKVLRNGIYLPDHPQSCAQVLIEGYKARGATVLRDPNDPNELFDRFDTSWTLVERVADSGGGTPGATDPLPAGVRLRCPAGQPCPQAGWWFTPSSLSGRQQFAQGQTMPAVISDYGSTIWQWDEDQSS